MLGQKNSVGRAFAAFLHQKRDSAVDGGVIGTVHHLPALPFLGDQLGLDHGFEMMGEGGWRQLQPRADLTHQHSRIATAHQKLENLDPRGMAKRGEGLGDMLRIGLW